MTDTLMGGPSLVDGLPEADYFRHPALSHSGAKLLLPPSCPAIYRWQRDHPPESKPDFDFGHAAHQMALGVGQPIEVIDADNWMTKAAKEERALAYELGRTPLLRKDYERVVAMRDVLDSDPQTSNLFAKAKDRGVSERSLIWQDDEFGIERRCRVDWGIYGDRILLVDYKTSVSAEPTSFAKSVANFGYDSQDDWYRAGARAVFGTDDVAMVFVVQEKTAPYIPQVYELSDEFRRVGLAKNRRAMEVFAECSARDTWPAYSSEISVLEPPSWYR